MRASWCITALLVLAGCQDPESGLIGNHRVNEAGAHQLLDAGVEPFSAQRLANLISVSTPPAIRARRGRARVGRQRRARRGHRPLRAGRLRAAPTDTSQMEMRAARNEIQGTLITASANRCNAYNIYLRRLSSNTQFALGSLATAFGGAGALFTNGTSAIFASLAGVTSGVSAEYQRDMMSNLTTSVIIPGIEKQRSAVLGEIAQRRCLGVGSYPLTLAIADVVRFHGACSADMGIAAAGQAVSQTNTTSLDTLLATVQQLEKLHTALHATPPARAPAAAAADAAGHAAADAGQPPLLGDTVTLQPCGALEPRARPSRPASAAGATGAAGVPSAPAARRGCACPEPRPGGQRFGSGLAPICT